MPGVSRAAAPRGALGEAGLGFGAVGLSLFYTPAKLFYAGGGALTAVSAYALTGGRRDVFWTIINPALRGDYVVTPEHLLGERRIVFMGPFPEDLEQPPEDDRASDPPSGETQRDSF
jgi:hypothetical protein